MRKLVGEEGFQAEGCTNEVQTQADLSGAGVRGGAVGAGVCGLPHLVMGPVSPALQADCLPLSHRGSAYMYICAVLC